MDNTENKFSWLKDLESSVVSLERISRSNPCSTKPELEIVNSTLLGFDSIKKLLECNYLEQEIASVEWELCVYTKSEEPATKESVNNLNRLNGDVCQLSIEELSRRFAY